MKGITLVNLGLKPLSYGQLLITSNQVTKQSTPYIEGHSALSFL